MSILFIEMSEREDGFCDEFNRFRFRKVEMSILFIEMSKREDGKLRRDWKTFFGTVVYSLFLFLPNSRINKPGQYYILYLHPCPIPA